MPNRLNDYTAEEIAARRLEIAARRVREDRPCLWCEKVVPMRADQHFCRPACRTAYSHAAAQIAHDRLVSEKEAWLHEREALIKEIADLQKKLGEAETPPVSD